MYMPCFASASAQGARKAAQKSGFLHPVSRRPFAPRTGIFLPSAHTQKFSVYGPLSLEVHSAKLSCSAFWSRADNGSGRNATAGVAMLRTRRGQIRLENTFC